jgi:hypothetical protein
MARRGQTGRFVPNYKKIEYMKNHKLYKGKYRTQTLRWTKCAYREGTHFVTINSKGYNWPFGQVINGKCSIPRPKRSYAAIEWRWRNASAMNKSTITTG